MNNDLVKQLIQGLGVMTELWAITYNSFKSQGFTNGDAINHTKAFMSVVIGGILDQSNKEGSNDTP